MAGSVAPSRLEAGFSCFDHFLAASTRSGESLGYKGAALKARTCLSALSSWAHKCWRAPRTLLLVLNFCQVPSV